MGLPNFIIIGAGRAGTTSLYYYLGQHPEVFLSPVKETRFFAFDTGLTGERSPFPTSVDLFEVRSWEAYQRLFDGRTPSHRAAGEASPIYLFWPGAAERIAHRLPDVKLLAILRDPVERAYSSYMKYVRDGVEPRTFEQVIDDELTGPKPVPEIGQCTAVLNGYYHRHLSEYLARFPRQNIAIFFYDDLEARPLDTMADVFRFIGVDADFKPDVSIRYNVSGVAKKGVAGKVLRKNRLTRLVRRTVPEPLLRAPYRALTNLMNRNLVKPAIAPETRARLVNLYRDDILRLQDLTGRDLSAWLDTEQPAALPETCGVERGTCTVEREEGVT